MATVNKISSKRVRKPRKTRDPRPTDLVLFHFEMTRQMRDSLQRLAQRQLTTSSALARSAILQLLGAYKPS